MKDGGIFKPTSIFKVSLLYRLQIAGRKCLSAPVFLLPLNKMFFPDPLKNMKQKMNDRNKCVFRLRKRELVGKCNSSDVGLEDWTRNKSGAKWSHQFLKHQLCYISVYPKGEADAVICLFAVENWDLHLLWSYSPIETQQVETHAPWDRSEMGRKNEREMH